ncbi:MAG TPA: DUF3427 domain-containing protein, partial [Candidatus Dormibacteraeota bacterium]|nr:DUF3427 domain-containing protein [Candidatus Dormibacteraeota bacterium]
IKLNSHEDGEIIQHFKDQFDEVWNESQILTEQWIENYEKTYVPALNPQVENKIKDFPSQYQVNTLEEAIKIKPNKMQEAALKQIEAVRGAGEEKGLVISATGTGKTYLAAFDVRRAAPKRMLFIVHREQILNKAKDDFKKVLGGLARDFGILSGSSRQTDAKYLFATIQTMSKEGTLYQFDPTTFDYILIDEVHKAGADSYQRVIDYFKPKFLLGMTATPERTDDSNNIFALFDYNIAYEIRLQEALEEDMLCPFHYFGVTDFEYNGQLIDDAALLSNLVTDERVNHIIEKMHYYGFSGEEVKGLIFCRKKEEAKQLSTALNERGYQTVALTGDHSQEERLQRVNQLENGVLDYILTVDIFNEGVDIPSINQVVMVRQTQSSIIFIQQLGRGLRKHGSKDFVTVIDFIGNYKNNYLIPIALSGDHSQNKDNIRRHVKDTSYIKGISTVNFEEIARQQIFDAINKNNLTAMRTLRDAYSALKNRIGRVPRLYDFITNHSIDPVVITDNKQNKISNYHHFLIKMKEEMPALTDYENSVLSMFSLEILNGKRKHEIILLDLLLDQEKVTYDQYTDQLTAANCQVTDSVISSVQQIFRLSFFNQNDRRKYGEKTIITLNDNNTFAFNSSIRESLEKNTYFKEMVRDVVETAKEKSKAYQSDQPFTLYEKYTRKDACRLLNWESDESGTINGYRVKYNTCPIFITYHKHDQIDPGLDYGDEFLNQELLKWYSTKNRTLKTGEIQTILNAEIEGIDLHIFVKKDDDEGRNFYYLGQALPDRQTVEQGEMVDKKGKVLPVVHMNMMMEKSIDHKLYHYIKNEAVK